MNNKPFGKAWTLNNLQVSINMIEDIIFHGCKDKYANAKHIELLLKEISLVTNLIDDENFLINRHKIIKSLYEKVATDPRTQWQEEQPIVPGEETELPTQPATSLEEIERELKGA